MIKILTFSTLFPDLTRPLHGLPVETRLRHLLRSGAVRAQVVAPVPWFPFRSNAFGRYAAYAKVPPRETRIGIPVQHPRYPLIPKVGMALMPHLLYLAVRPIVSEIQRSGYDFDLIDSHHLFPDGVAAVMLGEHFGKPVTMTARGSDVNVFPQYSWPRRMILWAIARATATITVSQSLKASLAELGVPSQGILVLRNGVDLDAFKPKDPAPLLAKFSLRPPVLLSVGNLLAAKGHELVIRALLEVPDATLLIVGSGPDELRLRQIMDSLGLAQRVRFLGAVDHDALVDIYNVADVMVLASAREGLPNVLLESLACGTPVAATDVSGIPEIVTSPVAGRLFPNRTPGAVAETIRYLLANPVDRAQTRSFAEKFSWDETTRGQIDLFREILSSNQPHRPGPRTTS